MTLINRDNSFYPLKGNPVKEEFFLHNSRETYTVHSYGCTGFEIKRAPAPEPITYLSPGESG